MIDFSHPEWRALAQQLLSHSPVVIRGRQWQPLVGLLKDNQLLLAHGSNSYELTPAGRRYLTRELMLAEIATAPPEPEEWLHAQGWQLGEQVNERVLAALYRKSDVNFTPNEQIDFEDKGIRLCADQLLRLRSAQPFSLFFSSGTLIDAAPIGMMVVDQALQVEQANPAAASLFNCSPAELLGNQPLDRLLERDAVKRLSQAPANSNLEFTALRDGQVITLEVSMTPFQRDAREYYLVLLRDISDRKQAEQRLRFLAHFDPLTQLANRNQLLQRLELLVGAGCPLALLFIDIDHFKRINDTLGHEIGDRLLAEIAERLRQHMPANSLLARSGGDEFVCLLEGANADDGKNLGSELLNLFNDPFQVRQYSCNVSPSIGLTLCNGQQGSASDLLKQADLALYAAKDAGRNGLALFTPELSRAAELRQQLEQELRLALEREEFELFYQPQVDASGQAQSMEALLRWRSPSRGLVSPADFIPVLEETGLILEATRWVFRQACRQARRWQSEGRHWRIAVNLSPLDFRQHDLAGQLLQILADEQASAAWLELEITESALLDDGPQVRDCLARLKIAGLPLFLDDFGTGYASLTYLQQFDFDGIKIDRQFVANLPDSPQSVALVHGILTMAAQLGLEVVGEGVENERQAAFLLLNGCQRLQGFYYAKPQPAEVCEQARGFARGA